MKNRSYFFLIILLFAILSLSTVASERLRTRTISFFSPFWNWLQTLKIFEEKNREEMENLRLQNQLLVGENQKLKELLQLDWNLEEKIVLAQVIFRSPATWNSSLWINVGAEKQIKKNSPVLYGRSLVGVIDYVGEKQARVRLITDSGLTPSVRVLRVQNGRAHLLAKGELHGKSYPLWRKEPHLLKGIGFNYDFEDAEGPARDLRTGKPLDPSRSATQLPLIQVNDHLVTTGMDGVFPKGFEVAVVTKVYPLDEGDYYYDIEAKPTAGDFDKINFLFVVPPVGFDAEDQPTSF